MVELLVHRHDGIDWAFFSTRYVSRHVDDPVQVLVIDAALDRAVFDSHKLPKGYHAAVRPRQTDILQALFRGAIRTIDFDHRGDRFTRGCIMEQDHLHSRSSKRERMGHIRDRYAMLRRLHLIHLNLEPRLRVFNVPVRIHNPRSALKDVLDLLSDLSLPVEIGAIDLGNESRSEE